MAGRSEHDAGSAVVPDVAEEVEGLKDLRGGFRLGPNRAHKIPTENPANSDNSDYSD